MTTEEEERLVQAVMEDSEREYKRCQEEEWEGLQEMLELSASGDVYVSELDMKQKVKMKVKEEATEERAWAPWSPPPPHPPCSTYRGHRAILGDAMTFLGRASHLWTPPTYIDLTKDDDGEDGGA